MRTFDDLAFGQVKSFHKDPGRNFGWITVLDDGTGKPGPDLWFHLHEGQYARYDGECIEWVGFTQGFSQLREPRPGDYVVFDYGRDREGRDKAEPWTYANLFFAECIAATTHHYRLLYGDTVVWEGSYSPLYETRLNGGLLPDTYTTIQRLEDDDAWDDGYGGSGGIIPGGWRTFGTDEQDEVYDRLVTASRFPRWHSQVIPPLREEYAACRQADRLFAEQCASQVMDG